jgi:hypothetical protein
MSALALSFLKFTGQHAREIPGKMKEGLNVSLLS